MALLQRWRRSEHRYMGLVVALACTFSVANLVPLASAQYVAALIFGPIRTLQWASYFLFLEQPDRYPPAKLGRMIGYGNLIIALVGDGPPTALKAFASHADSFDRYELIHGVLTAVLGCCIAFPLRLARDIRQREAKARGPALTLR